MAYTTKPLSEINVTPLVDVAMNLLIVFMITAPLMKQAFDVQLPKASAASFDVESEESVTLSIDRTGALAINESPVPREELALALDEAFKLRGDKTLFIEADKNVVYGSVITAMDVARRLELKMNLVYEPEQQPREQPGRKK